MDLSGASFVPGAPRAGQAAGGRRGPRTRPLAAGQSWSGTAVAAAGSPELWVEAAAAAGGTAAQQAPLLSGNQSPQARPLRGPGPSSGCGSCKSRTSTRTWGPVETVRHAPPPPAGAAAAALGREALDAAFTQASCRSRTGCPR